MGSLCPLCHSKNEGPPSAKGKQGSMVLTCFFCNYVYCGSCGDDASPHNNHFGLFSETNCGFDRYGVYKRARIVEEPTCCVEFCKTLGILLLGLLLYPFFLAFFSMIMTPYILVGRRRSTAGKVLMLPVGVVLGALLTPFFIVVAVLYTLCFLVLKALELCGCDDCECCSLQPASSTYSSYVNKN